MKVEVTDLKAPNDANSAVADATGVQVKLWISSDSNDPTDTGAPDVLETTETITSGVLSVPLTVGGTPAVTGTPAVRGTNTASSGTTDTLNFTHPGGLLIVAHTSPSHTGVDTTTATFDSAAMTVVGRAYYDTRLISVFSIDTTAKTADIVVTQSVSSTSQSIFAVPVGSDVEVKRFGTDTSNDPVSLSITLDTATDDLVLMFARWRNSGANVASRATDQTVVLEDDTPTRADSSKKTGIAGTTTVTLNFPSDGNNTGIAIAVVIGPAGISTSVGNPVLGVAKWEDSNETYFFPIDTTVQEDV